MSADGEIGASAGGWTAVRTALVIAHFDMGLSAAESAALIGAVSKNAVISKRRRLGLFATVELGKVQRGPDIRPRRGRPPCVRLRAPPPMRAFPLPEMEAALPAESRPATLVMRAFRQCAWPLGPAEAEGDFRTLFCCAPTSPGAVYCRVHSRRAYREEPRP